MTFPLPGVEPHVRAIDVTLKAGLPAAIGVGLGRAPTDQALPYAVHYPDPGDVQAARLDGQRQHLTLHFIVHAIGVGPEQANWVADRVRDVLLNTALTVPGRRLYRVTQDAAPPPMSRDDDVTPPLYVQTLEFQLRSDPA